MESLALGTLYGQIGLMCLLILGAICKRLMSAQERGTSNRTFLISGIIIILLVVVDCVYGLAYYGLYTLDTAASYVLFCANLLLITMLAFCWYVYAETVAAPGERLEKSKIIISLVWMLIVLVYLGYSVATGLSASFDEYGNYERGPLFSLTTFIAFSQAIFACVKSYERSHLAKYYEDRTRLKIVSYFAIIPVICAILQMFLPLNPMFVSSATLAYMMIYYSTQRLLIKQDMLTGLNNRQAFDRYISSKINHIESHSKMYVILIDIDAFKEINIMYGPLEGDKALKTVALALKEVAAEYDFFVARYDDDDFAAVVETTSHNMYSLICDEILSHIDMVSQGVEMKKCVSVNLASAAYTGQTIPQLLHEVDVALEKEKKLKEVTKQDAQNLSKLLEAYESEKAEPIIYDTTGINDKMFSVMEETSQKLYIYVTNLETNVTRWSKGAARFLDIDGEYDYDTSARWLKKVHPDDVLKYQKELDAVYSGKKDRFKLTYRIRTKDDTYVSCTGYGRIIKGDTCDSDLFAGTIINHGIADGIDAITDLPDMAAFTVCLGDVIFRHESVSVLLIGISKYIHINDTYGYKVGDELLRDFSAKLRNLVTKDVSLYKLDGAKFAFVGPYMTESDMRELYEKAKNIAFNDLQINGNSVKLRLAAGAVAAGEYDGDVDIIKTSAMYALSMSKHEKHGDIVFFNNKVNENDIKKLDMIAEIHDCVLDGFKGFFMCFQPIIDAKTGKIVGAESLIRWRSDKFGIVPPDVFIPWLEEDTCIYLLGNWIIDTSVRAAKQFQSIIPDFFVNVNVAATQLENVNFKSDVIEIVKRHDFNPENLWIELTERCKDLDLDFLSSEITFFNENGIRVALDDYGTGQASLSLALILPIGEIKIDRTFTKDVMEDKRKSALIESILLFANKSGIRTCIEGIETLEMADFLSEYGPMYYQGYAYSKPIVQEEFMKLISQ